MHDNTWLWWDAFFNRWILRGIKQNKERLTVSEREAKQTKKPKPLTLEEWYLKNEGITLIESKQTPEEVKKYQEELERKANALREKTIK